MVPLRSIYYIIIYCLTIRQEIFRLPCYVGEQYTELKLSPYRPNWKSNKKVDQRKDRLPPTAFPLHVTRSRNQIQDDNVIGRLIGAFILIRSVRKEAKKSDSGSATGCDGRLVT